MSENVLVKVWKLNQSCFQLRSFTAALQIGLTFTCRSGLFQCSLICPQLRRKLRPHSNKCLNGALGQHEPPALLHWAFQTFHHVDIKVGQKCCLYNPGNVLTGWEAGDRYRRGGSAGARRGPWICLCRLVIFLRTETVKHNECVGPDSRRGFGICQPVKGPKWMCTMPGSLPRTGLTEAFAVGNKHLGEKISFHAWHTCSQPLLREQGERWLIEPSSSVNRCLFLPRMAA